MFQYLINSKATPSTQRSINSKDWFDFTYLLISLCFILIKYFTPYCYNIFLFPSAKQASLNERKIKLKVLFWLNEVRVVCWPPALAAPFHSTSLPPAKKNKVFFRGLPFRSIHSALLVWCWVCFHCCGALAALQPITHNNSINPNQTNCLLQRAARIQSN